jgi:putative addiction module component (TIGR02574 family)
MSVNEILAEVMQLPPSSRASLVEKIVESIAVDIDPAIERSHLDAVARRRQEATADPSKIIDGDDVMRDMRALLRK